MKTNDERVTMMHRWREGTPEFVVYYDAPRSRKLRELQTFEADRDPDARKSVDADMAAHYFRKGYVQALNDMENTS